MVYITGDRHGNFRDLMEFSDSHQLAAEDLIIVLGDAGVNYYLHGRDRKPRKQAARIPATILCIHGNHEARPASLPHLYREIPWRGGLVYQEEAYPNLLFAKDGEIYDIAGLSTLVIGGAYSIDKDWRQANGIPWFADEQADEATKHHVEEVLTERGWQVDIVLSHTCPATYTPTEAYFEGIDQSTVDTSMERWLDGLEDRIDYRRWYCGHWHIDKTVDKVHFLYAAIEPFGAGL